MNKTDIKGCRRMLEAKRAELLLSPQDTTGIAIPRVPDSMEEFSLEVEQSMAVDALDRKTALLRQVTEALERIAEGNYGECLTCQQPISAKRLAALPWAALCIECQQAAEIGGVADAQPSVGLRLGYRLSHHREQHAGHSGRHDHPLRRPEISRRSTDAGATESEARF
jgi:DnaK suppressor protein